MNERQAGWDVCPPRPWFRLKPAVVGVRLALVPGLVLGLIPGTVVAAPTGGQVKAGSASISQNAAKSVTTIRQRSQRAALDWQSFDVGKHEQVRFQQPNAKASALNRIFDQKPSEIFGQVKANGQVVLMNPNGVFFKPGAQVNVGSLVAGAMRIGIDDFMRGNYTLEALEGAGGRVVNQGRINANAGDVALIGRSVANEGVIVATAGRVHLAAGEQVTVDFDGDGLLRFAVDKAVVENAHAIDDQVANSGNIVADGGDVLITARAAEGVFRNAINNSGVIRAGRIENQGGKIMLVGTGPGASVLNSGQLDASAASATDDGGQVGLHGTTVVNTGHIRADATQGDGGTVRLQAAGTTTLGAGSEISVVSSAGGSGGHVAVLGEQVALEHDAAIDASGSTGGGEVLIGGDFRGANPAVVNANTTFVSSAARIDADATDTGDGGKVVVWADDTTRFHGHISATGGESGGDGGLVEVSGKDTLVMRGVVDVTAAAGATGTLLLDPSTLTIIDEIEGGGDFDFDLVFVSDTIGAGDPNLGANTLSWGAIDGLAATANVVLEATGLVTIADVTGNAGGTITSNNLVLLDFTTGSLTITSTTGDVVFADTADVIRTEGGAITINAAGAANVGGFNTTGAGGGTAGAVTINAGGNGTLGAVNTGGGVLSLFIGGTLTQVAGTTITGSTALTKGSAGTVVLSTANDYSGATTVSAGTLRAAADDGFSADSAISLSGTGTLDVDGNNVTVASLAGVAGTTLALGAGGDITATTDIDLSDITVTVSGDGDNVIDASGGTLTTNAALAKTDSGNLSLGGGAAINLGGSVTVSDGDLTVLDDFTLASGDLTASGSIAFDGAGTSSFTAAAIQTVTSTAGSITDSSGAVLSKSTGENLVLAAGTDIGVSTANRLGVAVTGGGALELSATGSDVFVESASNLVVAELTTGAGADTVDIATSGTAALTLAGPYTDVDGDAVTLAAGGNLSFTTTAFVADTLAVSFGTGGGVATLDIDVDVSGTTDFTIAAGAGTSTVDLSALTADLSVTATANGAGSMTGAVVVSSYTGVDNITAGSGDNTLATNIAGGVVYVIDGADTGTSSFLAGGAGRWTGFVNLTGGAGNDNFTVSGGTLSGIADGAGGTGDTLANDTAFTISGADAGSSTAITSWQNIENLSGTAGADTFTVAGGTLSGTADGLGGADALSGDTAYTISGANSGTGTAVATWQAIENLSGTAGADTFTVDGGTLSGTVDGLGDTDTLIGDSGYTISGANSGTGTAVANWQAIENLSGTTGADTFAVAGGTLSGTVDGLGGTDTLSGNSTYTVTGSNSGTSTAIATWRAIENLVGTAGDDTFGFADGGSLSGTIDGLGHATFDTLTYVAKTDATVSVNLATGAATAINGNAAGGVQNVERFVGSSAVGNDTLTGRDDATSWAIDGVGDETSTDSTATTHFTGFEILQGGSAVDTFTITGDATFAELRGGGGADRFSITGPGGGTVLTADLFGEGGLDTFEFGTPAGAAPGTDEFSRLVGSIDGGPLNDTIDFSGSDLTQVVSNTGGNGSIRGSLGAPDLISGTFASIQTLIGNGLAGFGGPDVDTFWHITGTNSGTFGATLLDIALNSFSGISIQGGSANDVFIFDAAGRITSGIDGGAGVNTLMGSIGVDVFNVLSGDSVSLTIGANTTTLTNITHIDSTVGGASFVDTGNDTFNLNGVTWGGAIDGGGGTNTLNGATSYTVTGADAGTSGGVTGGWSNIANLNGTAGADTFTVTTGSLSGAIDGLGGNDTLAGSTSYAITGADAGTAASLTGGWQNIENLSGTAGADLFTVAGGTLSGTVDGLIGTDALSGDTSYTITGANAGTGVAVANWQGVENLSGTAGGNTFTFSGATASLSGTIDGNGGTDTIAGTDHALAYALSGANTGTVTSNAVVANFIDITHLTGSSVADSFTFAAGSSLGGDASGLGGADTFTLLGNAAVSNLLGGADADTFDLGGFTLTGALDGGASGTNNDTLRGSTAYVITGANAGTSAAVSGGWTGIENLSGTTGADLFTVAGGTLSGTVDGLGGADTLDGDSSYTITGANSGTGVAVSNWQGVENLTGTAGGNTFTFSGATASLSGTIDGNGGTDTVAGTAHALLYTLTAVNGGNVVANGISASFVDIANLTGSSANDTFTVAGGTLSGTIDGGAGVDTLAGDLNYTVTGPNAGTSTSVAAWQNIANLTGTGADNLFLFNAAGALTGTVDGLGGTDTVQGTSTAMVFTLTGVDDGTLLTNGDTATYQNIENLTGSSAADTFDVAGGTLSGTADGAGGSDTLAGDTSYTVNAANAGTSNSITAWTAIENLRGSTGADTFTIDGGTLSGSVDGLGGNDTLIGNTDYVITAANAGTASAIGAGWQAIENLTGTAAANLFTFNAAGSLSGTIDGAGGTDTVAGTTTAMVFTLTGAGSGTVATNGVTTTFQAIENLTGSSAGDSFVVDGGTLSGTASGSGGSDTLSGDTSYTVTGANSGTSGAIAAWLAIENLVGSAGADTFDFNGGSLSGSADGLAGNDTFNVTVTTSVNELIGGADDDTFNITGDAVLTTTITGGTGSDTVNFGTPTGAPPGADRSRLVGDLNLGIEAGDNDRIDFSGSDLAQIVDAKDAGANEQFGTIRGAGPDLGTHLISGGFTGVESFVGNGKGTLIGPNGNTFWLISGTNTGTFGDTLVNIAANSFVNFSILAGSGNDTVVFTTGAAVELDGGLPGTPFASVGFNGGGGTNVLMGSVGNDLFEIAGPRAVNYTNPNGGQTRLENINHIDSTAGGGTFSDVGNDVFDFGTVTFAGSINGGAGSDVINVSKATTATINVIAANGMSSASSNFVNGGFAQIETLNTGSGNDNITLAVAPTGTVNRINLGPGTDTIRSTVAATWVINGPGDGAGVIRDLPGDPAHQLTFTGVENLTSTRDSALLLPTTAATAGSITGTFTAPNLVLVNDNNFTGNAGLRISGDVTHSGPLLIDADGAGDIEFRDDLAVTGGSFTSTVGTGSASYNDVLTSGNQTYNGRSELAGDYQAANFVFDDIVVRNDVTLTSTTGRFDFNGEVSSTTQPVLSIVPPFGTDIFIDSIKGVGHLRHDAFAGFDGTLAIGGKFVDTGAGVLDGELLSATADYIQISEDFITGGNLLLVGSTIEFVSASGRNLEVVAGGVGEGEFVFLALGDNVQGVTNDGIPGGTELGNITAPTNGTVTFTGGQATLAATNEVLNSNNMIMNLGRGPVAVAQSDTATNQQITFNVRSNASESALSVTDTAIVASLVANNLVTFRTPNALFQNARVSFPNPAAVLTILQAVTFVDASLFEEDLSLFGVIGNGIALSLDQCEEAEGCAPAVTEEELAALIAALIERITQLEATLAADDIDQAEGQRLLAEYRAQLANFLTYQQELRAYVERQETDEFGDDFEDEFGDVFEAEETLDPGLDEALPDAIEDSAPEELPAVDVEEEFETIEEPAAADEFENLDSVDEAEEAFEFEPMPEAEPEPALEPEPASPPAEPEFDGLEDEFEELEEELDDALIERELRQVEVRHLAGIVRIGSNGAVQWSGEVVLPTLHRRF